MKTALAPIAIVHADKEANWRQAERAAAAAAAAGARLLALPEMFSTGFDNRPEALRGMAEPADGPTMRLAAALAARHGMAVAGSFIAIDGADGSLRNRAFFVKPDGTAAFYDKYHLFTHSGENRLFEHGDGRPVIVGWEGWRIRLIVCYDLRFPVWCRTRNLDYDMLLVPANWPASRGHAYTTLLMARAIENQCAVLGVNRTGSDPWGDYPAALTQAFDYKGRAAGAYDPDSGLLTADLSLDAQRRFRDAFPVHLDADPFTLGAL